MYTFTLSEIFLSDFYTSFITNTKIDIKDIVAIKQKYNFWAEVFCPYFNQLWSIWVKGDFYSSKQRVLL